MYMSNADNVKRALLAGVDAGLTAAARNYTDAVRQRLSKGYTTGDFTTRGVWGRVMYTVPHDVPGGRAITCGTSTTAVPYELYWELGHQNAFTRRYERVEVWRPILEAKRDLLTEIIARNIRSRVASAGTTVRPTFTLRTGR